MTVLQIVRESFSMLSKRHKWMLAAITAIQMATGALDLAGVLILGLVTVLSVIAVSGEALPTSVQNLVDRLGWTGVEPISIAGWLCLIAGCALVLKTVVNALLARQTLRFLANRQASLSGELTAGLFRRPLLEVMSRASQDLNFLLTVGAQAATVGVLGAASAATADVALLAILGLGLTAVDPVVTIFTVLFYAILAVGLQRTMAQRVSRLGFENTFVDIESYVKIGEALSSYREVTVSDRRGLYVERIQGLRWQSARVSAETQFMSAVPKYVFDVGLVVGAIALGVSQFLLKDTVAAVGVVAIFVVAGSRILPALMRLQGASLEIRRSEAPAMKVFELARDLEPDSDHTLSLGVTNPIEIRSRLKAGFPDFHPAIEVEDVWLSYEGSDVPAVAGVTFYLPEGASLALVGSTGAGKSTLADLILGVVVPDSGLARLGGVSPGEAVTKWPGGIAYVPQEVSLANGTVRENVSLGLPREAVDDQWVWEALERAHLATYLRDFRDGLETPIGENGMRISGGQRQRLGIARALYTKPRLLVLDEATSALDAETEQAIAQTMQDLEGQVTTVTIAHRLATVRHCDLVLYLEAGQVIGRGTFADVREQSPAFDHQAQLLGL